jgi:hypothetical protein
MSARRAARNLSRGFCRRGGSIDHRLVRHYDHVLRDQDSALSNASEQSHTSTAGRLGQYFRHEVRRHAISVGHLDLIEHSHSQPPRFFCLRAKPSTVRFPTQQDFSERNVFQNGTYPHFAATSRALICNARDCNRVRA